MTPGWTFIVSGNIHNTLEAYGGQLKGFSQCRMTGTLHNAPVRIIPSARFPRSVRGIPFSQVIFHGCEPTIEQKGYLLHAHNAPMGR